MTTASFASNRLGLDYEKEASNFPPFPEGIIDVHTHLTGAESVKVYKKASSLYGVKLAFTMSPLEEVENVKKIMDGNVHFIAIPRWHGGNPLHDHGKGYLENIKAFHKLGARIAKFWCAPRIYDYLGKDYKEHPLRLNSPVRIETMKAAADLGMKFMFHIADPDTWFKTKYSSPKKYGTKLNQYEDFEEILSMFRHIPVIAAHMGGYSEDLKFLTALLERNPNLYLDSSATKWVVRELGGHPPEEVRDFFHKHKGRILFGTDIVTSDMHLSKSKEASTEMTLKASGPEEAFDLYASRFWALRKLFETDYEGESPIADPDLCLVNPEKFTSMDAPVLRGASIEPGDLEALYFGAAKSLLLS